MRWERRDLDLNRKSPRQKVSKHIFVGENIFKHFVAALSSEEIGFERDTVMSNLFRARTPKHSCSGVGTSIGLLNGPPGRPTISDPQKLAGEALSSLFQICPTYYHNSQDSSFTDV